MVYKKKLRLEPGVMRWKILPSFFSVSKDVCGTEAIKNRLRKDRICPFQNLPKIWNRLAMGK